MKTSTANVSISGDLRKNPALSQPDFDGVEMF